VLSQKSSQLLFLIGLRLFFTVSIPKSATEPVNGLGFPEMELCENGPSLFSSSKLLFSEILSAIKVLLKL